MGIISNSNGIAIYVRKKLFFELIQLFAVPAVQTASKTLMEAITEVYESSWSGHDLLYVQAQNTEMLWQDFSHKLGDQVLIPLNTYTNQFPEVRVSRKNWISKLTLLNWTRLCKMGPTIKTYSEICIISEIM